MEATTEATIALLAKHNELEIIDTPLDIYLEIPQLAYIEEKTGTWRQGTAFYQTYARGGGLCDAGAYECLWLF